MRGRQVKAEKGGACRSPCLGERGARGLRPRHVPAGVGCERAASGRALGRADCAAQLLAAVRDLLDRDDIHQAAFRLAMVQEWILGEAEAAATDPIFADPPPV